MKDRMTIIVWGAAVVTLLAGGVMTVGSLGQRQPAAKRLQRELSDLQTLKNMEATQAYRERVVEAFQKLKDARPVPPADLLKSSLPDVTAEVRVAPTDPVIPGWIAHRVEISLPGVPIEKLAGFVAEAESRRPPWRVVDCALKSSGKSEDVVQAKLVMESVERTQ